MGSRAAAVFRARLAGRLGLTADMVDAVNAIASDGDLTEHERALIAVSYSKLIADKFRPLRDITRILEEEDFEDDQMQCVQKFHHSLGKELDDTCQKAVNMLEIYLLPNASAVERVQYYRMIGDAFWLQLMIRAKEDKGCFAKKALASYEAAHAAAEALPPADAERLLVSLNLSAFLYDVMGESNRSWVIAEKAADEAGCKNALSEESYVIANLILENMEKWVLTPMNEPGIIETNKEDVDKADLKAVKQEEALATEVAIAADEVKEPGIVEPNKEDVDKADLKAVNQAQEEAMATEVAIAADEVKEPETVEPNEDVDKANLHACDQAQEEALADGNQAVVEVAGVLYTTPYSTKPPSPLVRTSVSPVDRSDFLGDGGWQHEDDQKIGAREIRRRQKAAQGRRGRLG